MPGYRLLEPLGSGASGTVYRALQEGLEREVAVKVLRTGLFDEEETRRRFLREARIQAHLSHPNLLPVFDAGIASQGEEASPARASRQARDARNTGQPYLVMELIEGSSLRDRIQREGALPLSDCVRIARATALGLEAAHHAGVVHRDLKPENILFDREGAPRISDFGLAKSHSSAQASFTATGIVLGTPGYVAPEVLDGRPADLSADVYALGAVLFEMLAGRAPFASGTVAEMLALQSRGRVPSLSSARSEVPAELVELVGRCLSRDPEQRPTSAELAAELESFAGLPSVTPNDSTRRTGSRSLATRRLESRTAGGGAARTRRVEVRPGAAFRSVRWTAGGILLSAVLAAGWFWNRGPASPLADAGAGVPAASRAVVAPKGPARSEAGEPGAPAAPPPKVVRMTRGATALRLELDRFLPSGSAVKLIDSEGTWGVTRSVADASGVLLLEGLKAGTRYSGVVGTAPGALEIAAGTRECLAGTAATLLESSTHCEDLVAGSRGGVVVALWRAQVRTGTSEGETMRIRLCESPDAGVTWTDSGAVDLGDRRPVDACMLVRDHGDLVAWIEDLRSETESLLVCRYRPRDGDWRPPFYTSLPREAHRVVAGTDAGGRPLLLVCSGQVWLAAHEASIWRPDVRTRKCSGPEPAYRKAEYEDRSLLLARAGDRMAVIRHPGVPELPDPVFFGFLPAAGGPAKLTCITEPQSNSASVSAAEHGGGLLLAYEGENFVQTRWLPPGAESFGPELSLPVRQMNQLRFDADPHVTSDGKKLHMAYIAKTPVYDSRDIELLTSMDGTSWRRDRVIGYETIRLLSVWLEVTGGRRVLLTTDTFGRVAALSLAGPR